MKILGILIGLLISIGFVFFLIFQIMIKLSPIDFSKENCEYRKYLKGISIQGKFSNVFEDSTYHGMRTWLIQSKEDTLQVYFQGDLSGIRDYLMIGDSISKNQNSLSFQVFRYSEQKVFKYRIEEKCLEIKEGLEVE